MRVFEGMIRNTELGPMIFKCNGVPIEREVATEIVNELAKTALLDSYDLYRSDRENQFFNSQNCNSVSINTPRRAALYLLECAGRHKIGVSSDIRRRVKELDNRPFGVTLLANSEMFDDAFKAEKKLQEKYFLYRVNGEWYKFPPGILEEVAETVWLANAIDWGE